MSPHAVRAAIHLAKAETDDRRVVHLSLSPETKRLIRACYAWRGQAVERALAELDTGERDAVRRFLRRVAEELERGPTAG